MQNPTDSCSYIVREAILGPVRALHFTDGGVHTLDCSPELAEAVGELIPNMPEHKGEPVTLLGKLIGKGHGGAGFTDLPILQFIVTHAVYHGRLVDVPEVIEQLCPGMPFAILPLLHVDVVEPEAEDASLGEKLHFLLLVVKYGEPVQKASPLIAELFGEERAGNGVQIDAAMGDVTAEGFDPFYDIMPLRSAG